MFLGEDPAEGVVLNRHRSKAKPDDLCLFNKDLGQGLFFVVDNGELGECLSIDWEIGSFVY